MAILNVTPDSFSDGGELFAAGSLSLDRVMRRAEAMVHAGADWFDIGGESTRPGAAQVTASEEADRVLPVVKALVERFDLPVSVDTSTPTLMLAAAEAGASMINDVRALQRPGALEAAAQTDLAVCLMHMQGQPGTMQTAPSYQNVCAEVSAYLQARASACVDAGIDRQRILIDPGFGFGKTLAHNLSLFRAVMDNAGWPFPLLIGVSRKSMFGSILSNEAARNDAKQRLSASLALAALAAYSGVAMIRVHDVRETRDVVEVIEALQTVGE